MVLTALTQVNRRKIAVNRSGAYQQIRSRPPKRDGFSIQFSIEIFYQPAVLRTAEPINLFSKVRVELITRLIHKPVRRHGQLDRTNITLRITAVDTNLVGRMSVFTVRQVKIRSGNK